MLRRNTVSLFERTAFWVAVALAVTMALLPHPPHIFLDRLGDKAEHALGFAAITLLAAFAFPQVPRLRIAERLSFMGALIEVFQSIPALHRDCDVRDWIVDSVAILAMLGVLALIRQPRGAFSPK